jgi:hypothetical protein
VLSCLFAEAEQLYNYYLSAVNEIGARVGKERLMQSKLASKTLSEDGADRAAKQVHPRTNPSAGYLSSIFRVGVRWLISPLGRLASKRSSCRD